jgi:hypothetical protein
MSFSDSLQDVDDVCLAVFGLAQDGFVVEFTPQDGSGTKQIDGIIKKPALEEEFLPGNSNVVRLFVRLTEIVPAPRKGDVIAINGKQYVIAEAPVDSMGGAVLKLRAS